MPDQQARSLYIAFLVQPDFPEAALAANDYQRLRDLWSHSSPEQVEDYLSVFAQPGALTGALNWYRAAAALQDSSSPASLGRIAVPTLTIWGNRDEYLGRAAHEHTPEYMDGPYRLAELDAGHWLVQEDLQGVFAEVLGHLRENPMTGP